MEVMEMKVALCGKMASGKTTMAKKIVESLGFNRFSLATGVKDFGNYLFDIPKGHKDRIAYQKVGEGGRNFLYPEIWIEVLLKSIESSGLQNIVVDDVRYENEINRFKEAGWKIVKINIEDNHQVERLQKTYPDDWETHAKSRNHPSESEIDTVDANNFDLIIEASNPEKYDLIFTKLSDWTS